MNIHEGARRIKSIGCTMLFAALGVFALLLCLQVVGLTMPALGIGFAVVDLILLPRIVAIPGAAFLIVGWIVEGFGAKAAAELAQRGA